MIDRAVIDAFHLMWGKFPLPVRLIHKTKKVLAVNDAAQSMGMEVGVPCFSFGNPDSHKACKANEALSSNEGQRMDVDSEKIKFWCPIKGYPDVFIHFVVTIAPPNSKS